MLKLKRCPKCNIEKPIDAFYALSKARAMSGYCRECSRKIQREWWRRRHLQKSSALVAQEILRALTDRPQTTRELLAILQARIGDDISTQKVSRTLACVLGDRVQRDELVSSFAANKKVSVYRLIGDTREYTPDAGIARVRPTRKPRISGPFGMNSPRWSKDEIDTLDRILKSGMPNEQMVLELLTALPARSFNAICMRAYVTRGASLRRPSAARRWTVSDDARLLALSKTETAEAICIALNRTLPDIMCRARHAGLLLRRDVAPPQPERKPGYVRKPRPERPAKPEPRPAYAWSEFDDEEQRQWAEAVQLRKLERERMRKIMVGV